MTHPKDSDLLLYFYGDGEETDRIQIKQHLNDCKQCVERLSSWRNVSQQLDQWEVPVEGIKVNANGQKSFSQSDHGLSKGSSHPFANAAWMIGIAAMIVIGFVIGRLTNPSLDRNDISAMIDQRLIDYANADAMQKAFDQRYKQHEENMRTLLQKQQDLVAQSGAGDLSKEQAEQMHKILEEIAVQQYQLRQDLQTLAINAESKINENRTDLNQLIRRTSLEP